MTGLALLTAPSVVIRLLIGPSSGKQLPLLGRTFGGGLVSLGVAGLMPNGAAPDRGVLSAFTIYNAATAATLGAAGVSGSAKGVALWPVVAFHGGVAAALARGALSETATVPAAERMGP